MKIKAIIIEDELPAARHLQKLVRQCRFDVDVIAHCDTVASAVGWFRQNEHPDLLFLDIQLADGSGFEILNKVSVKCPVIFTTAYEEYAIKAFKVNSIDYLLKPIDPDDLEKALEKYTRLAPARKNNLADLNIDRMREILNARYKSRFIVNAGLKIRSVDTGNIACFHSMGKSSYLLEYSGKSYDIRYSLDQLEEMLDPDKFFRISRQYIVNLDAIREIIAYSGSRLKILIRDSEADDLIVSRGRIAEFRAWLDR